MEIGKLIFSLFSNMSFTQIFLFFKCFQRLVTVEKTWILAVLSFAAVVSHSWFASHSSGTLTSSWRVGTSWCIFLSFKV